MQKIVDEVLDAEKKAKVVIDQARDEAASLKSRVESEITESLKETRDKVQNEIKTGIEKARMQAEADYKKAVSEAEEANKVFLNENSSKIDSVVDKIVELLVKPEFNRE